MASLNPQNAAVYGLTAQQLMNTFDNATDNFWLSLGGNVTAISNSFVTVYPFTPATQTANNAQAIEYLFPSINSGPNVNFNILTQNQIPGYESSYFTPFSNTSSVQINPASQTAVANLSNAVLASQQTVVADSSLTFTFIPGTNQTQTLTYQTGTTLSNAVTNGITNTTTTGTTTTVTTGVSATGTIPGASTTVSTSVAQAWTVQNSQAISYSDSQTDTVNTNVTTSVAVNVNSATPNSSGQYVYTSSTGQTFTLIPGNQYVSEVQISQSAYNTPVPNTFNLTGPNMTLAETLVMDYGLEVYNIPVTNNVEQAIWNANNLGYSLYSGVDPSTFSYQTSPIAQAMYYGLISSQSLTGTNATVVIVPVATTSDAITTNSASNTVTQTMLVAPNAVGTTNLDLHAAAVKLKSSFGIYYDNTSSENQITTHNVQISGQDYSTVKVGNLDYTLKNFSDSVISTGSGNNKAVFVATDVNNSVNLGSGNNEVDLNGLGNSIHLGNGANWINVTGGTGKNYVVAGDGPTTLSISSDSGFTQVSNWNTSEDAIVFSPNIARSNIHIVFDSTHWSQDVYVNNKLVANILTTGGLKFADTSSTVYSQTYAAPMPYNVQSNEGFVNGLYVDAFARTADSGSISYWAQQLTSGASRKAVIQDFLASNEYNANHLSNSAFVSGVYQNVLGRQADASGASYWNAQLDAGASRVAMVGTFLAGTEFNHLVGAS